MTLPCPCCGQPTDHPGVRMNARASAMGRRYEAQQRLAKLVKAPRPRAEEIARVRQELADIETELAELAELREL